MDDTIPISDSEKTRSKTGCTTTSALAVTGLAALMLWAVGWSRLMSVRPPALSPSGGPTPGLLHPDIEAILNRNPGAVEPKDLQYFVYGSVLSEIIANPSKISSYDTLIDDANQQTNWVRSIPMAVRYEINDIGNLLASQTGLTDYEPNHERYSVISRVRPEAQFLTLIDAVVRGAQLPNPKAYVDRAGLPAHIHFPAESKFSNEEQVELSKLAYYFCEEFKMAHLNVLLARALDDPMATVAIAHPVSDFYPAGTPQTVIHTRDIKEAVQVQFAAKLRGRHAMATLEKTSPHLTGELAVTFGDGKWEKVVANGALLHMLAAEFQDLQKKNQPQPKGGGWSR